MTKKLLVLLSLTIAFSIKISANVFFLCPNDSIPPEVVYCPESRVIFTNGLTTYLEPDNPIFTDDCGVEKVVSSPNINEPLYLGDHYISHIAYDSAGNHNRCLYRIDVRKTSNSIPNSCPENLLVNSDFKDSTLNWTGEKIEHTISYVTAMILLPEGHATQRVEAKAGYDYFLRAQKFGNVEMELKFLDVQASMISPPKSSEEDLLSSTAPNGTKWLEVTLTNIDTVDARVMNLCLVESVGTKMYEDNGCPRTQIDGAYSLGGYNGDGKMLFIRRVGQDSTETCVFSGTGLEDCQIKVEKIPFVAHLINGNEVELREDTVVIQQHIIRPSIEAKFSQIVNVHYCKNSYFLTGYSQDVANNALVIKLDSNFTVASERFIDSNIGYPKSNFTSTILSEDAIFLFGRFGLYFFNGVLISTKTNQELDDCAGGIGNCGYSYIGNGIFSTFTYTRNSYSTQGSSFSISNSKLYRLENDELETITNYDYKTTRTSAGHGASQEFLGYIPTFSGLRMNYAYKRSDSGPFIHSWKTTWESYLSTENGGVSETVPLALFSNSPNDIGLKSVGGFFESDGNIYRLLSYEDDTKEIQRVDCDLNTPVVVCPGNLLRNPSFQNNLIHWQNQGAAPQNNGVQLCQNGNFIQQTLSAEEGKTYKLELKAKSQTANHTLRFGLKFLNANWQVLETHWVSFGLQNAISSDFVEKIAPFGSVWMEITAINENDACLEIEEICLTSPNGNGTPMPDLELSIRSEVTNPPLWSAVPFSLLLENKGTESMYDVQLELPAQMNPDFSDKMAYISHSTDAKSAFNYWSGVWEVPKLEPGESVELNYTVFRKTAEPISIFAQIIEQRPLDLDSNPANNTTQIPNEDDEAILTFDMAAFTKGRSTAVDMGAQTRIFPNPTSQVLFVNLADYARAGVNLTLVDALGRNVKVKKIAKNQNQKITEMDVSTLENGLYFLRIESNEMRPLVLQVMVEHGR